VSKATGQPVIHFYAPVEGEVSLIPGNEIVSKVEKVETDSEKQLEQPIIAPQYIGSSSAPSALIVFGSSTQLFIDNVKAHSQTGLVLVRQYRPWSVQAILNVLPKSVKTLGLAEQIKSRTTAWSPLVLDYVADIHASGIDRDSAPKPVAFHLGQVTEATVNHVFAAISSNLTSASPVQNLTVGSGVTPNETKEEVKAEALTLETAYTKILHELFKEVNIINASDKKDAGLTSPEYGYVANRFYPSTQRCAVCGNIKKNDEKITLSGNKKHGTKHNEYVCYNKKCPNYGKVVDRDMNAMMNLTFLIDHPRYNKAL
jgi:sulfite reductase (NADPH) hemoprotein beta-component